MPEDEAIVGTAGARVEHERPSWEYLNPKPAARIAALEAAVAKLEARIAQLEARGTDHG